jgi:hypothetical protein
MAKNTGTLAGLAALAGAAYLMNKDKEASDFQKGREEQTGKLVQNSRGAGYDSTENRLKTPAESIADSTVKPSNAGEDYSNEGYGKGINQAGATGTTTLGPAYNEPSKSSVTSTKPKAKGDIVSKKQMDDYKAKFGQDKTLRDYMNSQRAMKNEPIKPVQLPGAQPTLYKRGGAVKKMASGGMTASKRADGIASKGKTRCKMY